MPGIETLPSDHESVFYHAGIFGGRGEREREREGEREREREGEREGERERGERERGKRESQEIGLPPIQLSRKSFGNGIVCLYHPTFETLLSDFILFRYCSSNK